jgi:SAM-dependent methyltransferase
VPGSIRENDDDLRAFVSRNGITSVLDVGPGRGTYARVLAPLGAGPRISMDAVEVWEPYVSRYNLRAKYRRVMVADIRDWHKFTYDLVIFGDVLEHMPREHSVLVWSKARQQARFVMMSVPIIHYPQSESHGNPYEVHVQEHLTPDEIRADYGPFVEDWCYETTGTFIAAGGAGDG